MPDPLPGGRREIDIRTATGIDRREDIPAVCHDLLPQQAAGRRAHMPANPLVAASGAWTAPDIFTVKIVLYETPFYSTLNFKFDGDRLLLDAEHNVSFGPTKLPQLTGHIRTTE